MSPAVVLVLQQMEGRLRARIDAHHTHTEALFMRAIQGDIQAAISHGWTPQPMSSLPPRPSLNPQPSSTTQDPGPLGITRDPQDPNWAI
ncbi:hypothetical protein Hanom_Chr00s175674g01830371 [Helianthus anomalus]